MKEYEVDEHEETIASHGTYVDEDEENIFGTSLDGMATNTRYLAILPGFRNSGLLTRYSFDFKVPIRPEEIFGRQTHFGCV